MDQRKNVILLIAILLAGIVIGGTISYFVLSKAKSATEVSETSGDKNKEEKQLYTCSMHPEVIMDEPGNCPKCGMKLVPLKKTIGTAENKPAGERKILYWQAPMDPTEIYDHPGKSKMGMDLVPVYEDQVSGGSIITIDPATVQNIGVRTTTVKRKALEKVIRTVATITYDEEKLYRVNTKISGWIEKLYVNTTGQQVKKGDKLLEIYSPELVSTQEEYLLALKNRDLVKKSSFQEIKESSESLLKSTRQRLELWDISEPEIQALEKRGKIIKTMKLFSPVDGVVIHKNVEQGMHVKEGIDLFHLADLSTVWAYATVYEFELPWIKAGQRAEMELAYVPGKTFLGKVDYIYPYLNKKARDIKVRLIFDNPKLELKPDMYANVHILAPAKENALVIPNSAVIRSGERQVVFVMRGEGKFEPREIKLGVEGENGVVEVVSGLLDGEQIVTSANFLLDSESRMQEAIQKMLEEKKRTAEQKAETHSKLKSSEKASDKEMASMKHNDKIQETKAGNIEHKQTKKEHVSAGITLYTCPMHPDFVTDDPNQRCPECGMELVKKKDLPKGTKLYTCSMHPEFVTDDPNANCPICEMKVVEKK